MADFTTSDLITAFLKEDALDATQKDSIREDLGLKTTDAVTFKNLILTALSLTGSQATGSVDIAATWNTTGTPTAFKINITNTASNANSLLGDFQVNGSSVFSFKTDGQFWCNSGLTRIGSGINFGGYVDLTWYTGGAFAAIGLKLTPSLNTLQLGETHATTATNQTLKAHNVTTGTGADLVLSGGTGSVAGGKVRTSSLGVFSLGPYTERIALTYGATLTPNCNDGLSRSVAMTGDQVINAPTNGVNGMVLKLKMLASGADRELTFHADIKKPTGTSYEATVVSGSTRMIELEYNGTAWMLIKNLEFIA